jgi:hypothetical protein
MQPTYKRNNEARSRDHCCRGKATSVTHSECVSVFLHIFCAVARTVQLPGKKLLNRKCVF